MGRRGATAALLCTLHFWAQAQTPTPPPAPLAPYQDRVIDGLKALDDEEEIAQKKYDSAGLPRGYSLEALSDQRQSQGAASGSLGLKASGYLDTLYYGSLSGNASLQSDTQGTGQGGQASFVLRQIGMPFDAGWRVDNALGMINLPALDLARKSPRISVPTPAMLGATSVWQQGRDLGLVAAVGQPGRFSGFPVAAFTASQGNYGLVAAHNVLTLGGGRWEWGAMAAQAQNVTSALALTTAGQGSLDAQGLYLAARHDWAAQGDASAVRFLQANALTGRNTGTDLLGNPNAPARGLWLDGGFGNGAHLTSWGLFRLEPGLSWLDLPMANDLQGAYARHNWRTRQWQTESSLELFNSLSGLTANGYYVNNNVRYQYTSRTSFGVGISQRNYGIQAQSGLLYTQFSNALGLTRAQIDVASADSGERQVQVKLDHEWSGFQELRLSTTLLLDRDQRGGLDTLGQGVAINANWSPGQRLSLTHSFQGRWSPDQAQYTLNSGLSWRFAPQWSLQGAVYAVNGSGGAVNLAQSPLTQPALVSAGTRDSGISITLRFEDSAGRARAPVGGAPGSAAGRLTGSVFLDDNQSGRREASEQGAANVTVLLDGRFATNTDAQGRFEFAYVTAGTHVLSVVSDNLPLPWGLKQDGRTEVRVFTRETTTVDIGAVRQ